ncbi:hypothetical protein DSL92_08435 [Billgrantia gudaonensis]|uniref:SAF domain-containing protein n=1 Tax=Billgrantia gudaonensis TaxID=376427 RepID=A0A3S0NED4_9GAMM|nr:hypothetical protein DSL92_08435 [Halomonas gudaonensis]
MACDIEAGTTLRAEHLATRNGNLAELPQRVILEADALVGKLATRPLRAPRKPCKNTRCANAHWSNATSVTVEARGAFRVSRKGRALGVRHDGRGSPRAAITKPFRRGGSRCEAWTFSDPLATGLLDEVDDRASLSAFPCHPKVSIAKADSKEKHRSRGTVKINSQNPWRVQPRRRRGKVATRWCRTLTSQSDAGPAAQTPAPGSHGYVARYRCRTRRRDSRGPFAMAVEIRADRIADALIETLQQTTGNEATNERAWPNCCKSSNTAWKP